MNYYEQRFREQSYAPTSTDAAFPKNALVEITNACNHACVFCHNPFMKRTVGVIDQPTFERFVTEAAALGLEEIGLYSTGEPFVVKNFEWFAGTSKRAGVRRVYVTSNGALSTLDRVKRAVEAGLDSIKFSINAGTRESYKLAHGKDDFDLVVANVRAIHEWKTRENVPLQMLGSFIYTTATKADLPAHRALFSPYLEDTLYMAAKSQGGRTGANIAEIIDAHDHPDLMAPVGPCSMLWNRVHLTCEGYLTACCVDYEHDLTYADFANGGTLAEMWNHPTIRALRERHLAGRLEGTICKNCLYGVNEPYEPISDLRGRFKKAGRFEAETLGRIRKSAEPVSGT